MNRTRPYRPQPGRFGLEPNQTGRGNLEIFKTLHSFLQTQTPASGTNRACPKTLLGHPRGRRFIEAARFMKSPPTRFLLKIRFGFKPHLPGLGPSGSVSNRTYRVWGPKVIFPKIGTYGRSAGCSGSSARAHRKKGIFNFSRICYTQYIQFWVTGRSVPRGLFETLGGK